MDGNRADLSIGRLLTMLLIVVASLKNVKTSTTCSAPKVSRINPIHASAGGSTQITVLGCGFKSAGIDGSTGTKLQFVGWKNYACNLVNTTLTDNSFVCETVRMPYGTYRIAVEQNGVAVPQSNHYYNRLRITWWRTPTIRNVNELSVPVGSTVKLYGRIFTDIYGSTNTTATNGKTVEIKRVKNAGLICELQRPDGRLYELRLSSESSDWGYIQCRLNGTYVGNQNLTFTVTGDYGANVVETQALRFSKTNEVYMFQTYAEITNVSPVNGSKNGGTNLKIKVKHLQNLAKVKVEVGGLDCPITAKSEENEEIECTVPVLPASQTCFAGNRGMTWELFDPTTKYSSTDEVSSAPASEFNSSYANDASHVIPTSGTRRVSRMRGIFIPPYDGEYVFMVKADDVGTLFMSPDCDPANKVQVAHSYRYTSNYFRYEAQRSNRTQLTANNRYYIELAHIDHGGLSHGMIGAQFYGNHPFTNNMLLAASPETVELHFNSDVTLEKQTVKFDVASTRTVVHEVQKISVVSGQGFYRLSLYGVYTAAISTTGSASIIDKALKELPWHKANFGFKVTGSTPNYQVEFLSDAGDQPLLGKWTQPGVSISITEVTAGQATGLAAQLKMGNAYTPPFLLTDSQDKVKEAAEELFTSMCNSALVIFKSPGVVHYDYDTTYPSHNNKEINEEISAFCGRVTVKNPGKLYEPADKKGLDFSVFKSICFAYLDEDTDISVTETNQRIYFRVDISYIPTNAQTASTKTFQADFPALSKNTWGYACFDLNVMVNDNNVRTGKSIKIMKVYTARGSEIKALHIDEFRISSTPTVELQGDHTLKDGQGISTLRRNRIKAVEKVTVVKTTAGTSTEYAITMQPKECDNSFNKFTTQGGQRATVTVTRTERANMPIEGTFKLTYKTTPLQGLPVDITVEQLKAQIETIPTFGAVNVERSGTCANFALTMKFVNVPGKMEAFQIDSTSVTGNNVKVTIKNNDAYLLMDPIPGEFLRLHDEKPQVTVSINQIPSKCSADNGCSFQQTDESTPEVTSIVMSSRKKRSVSSSTTLTIKGKNFDGTNKLNNKVTVGGKPCVVTSATSIEIVCTQDPSLYCETLTVHVNIVPIGIATLSQNTVACSCTSTITNVSPSSHGLGGGKVTVTGSCFDKTAEIKIDNKQCVVITRSPTTITCLAPVATAAASNLNVEITQGSSKITATQKFAYTTADTYKIDFTQKTVTAEAGQTITISGTDFQNNMLVTIDGKTLSCSVVTSTSLRCDIPVLSNGVYELVIEHPTKGRAVMLSDNSQPRITYKFEVKKVCPKSGSLLGGTTLRFEGLGLAPKNIKVNVGGHECKVDTNTNTDTTLKCTIVSTTTVHNVLAETTGSVLEWKPSVLSIVVGDKVKWCWNTSPYAYDLVTVEEVTAPSDKIAKSGGFKNYLAASRQGCFVHQFNAVKSHYFWDGKSRRGTIHVKALTPRIEKIKVEIGSIEAKYTLSSTCPADSSSCTGLETDIAGVTDPTLTSSNTGVFEFMFVNKRTPVIDKVTPTQGTSLLDVTLDGKGLPATSKHCQAEILLADKTKCIASSSSLTSMKCKIDTSAEALVLQKLPLCVTINNLGTALLKGERDFAILPVVTSLSPCQGSIKGGTKLTIGGFSFPSTGVSVTVGGVTCSDLTRVSFNTITCVTPVTAAAGDKPLSVLVNNNPAEFDTGVCKDFSYSTAKTPVCDALSPDQNVEGVTKTFSITMNEFNSYPKQDVTVTLDDKPVTVSDVQTGKLDISVTNKAVGNHFIKVHVKGVGYADCPKVLTGHLKVISVTPTTGGINGGTDILLTGNGFTCNTAVKIGGTTCKVDCNTVTLGKYSCTTAAKSAGDYDIVVGSSNTNKKFTYDANITPQLTKVDPTNAKTGDTITLTVDKISPTASENTVYVNDKMCPVTGTTTATQIQCILQKEKAGTYDVFVKVKDKGVSQTMPVTYLLAITGITKNEGSCYGGQTVTLAGSGIDASVMTVTICGQTCKIIQETVPTTTQLRCITPPSSTCTTDKQCNVDVTSGSITKTVQFTYKPSLTPKVTCVSPNKGGTGGGTTITISGEKFGTDKTKVKVSIGGSTCTVKTVTDTSITCQTGSRTSSITEHINVEIDGNGLAEQPTDDKCKFRYVDMWSSPFTWGNSSIPTDGDFVVIPKGKDIVLDVNTANLSVLLIQGKLSFEDNEDTTNSSIVLNAIYILVMNGGSLEVGTEDKPYKNRATIILHGHQRTPELPIYGAKSLAVREGTLDLHGTPIPHPWTRLSNTAPKGANTIELQDEADEWKVGDRIAIASTGDHQSQNENEDFEIKSISNDKKTLTLDKPLEYEHISKKETINGKVHEFAAEVALLSRNVRVMGTDDVQWHDKIEACEAGFDPGEFATQTCFQGRFGEEIGSNQYGVHIMIAPAEPNKNDAAGRISYTEVTNAGQAFRLGRYPIHFHLNGHVNKSYVKGCAIHKSFNRAVNIHGTHYLKVTNTAIYNIMGGAFFLEDGIETNNEFSNNLAIFVKASTSLLNDDITPAAFWVTHPNNVIQNNAAAGGSHFGFWYRMHQHPSGPSATSSICPRNEIMGIFANNTCHSQGWFCIWIFPIYEPKKLGQCGSNEMEPAVFSDMLAWNCEKGAESVVSGYLIFRDFVFVNNKKAGFEFKLISSSSGYPNMVLENVLVVARVDALPVHSRTTGTVNGIVLPYGFTMSVTNVVFVNFNGSSAAFSWTRVQGTCSSLCAGYLYYVSKLTFINSLFRVRFTWHFEGVLIDLDGSLTNKQPGSSLSTTVSSLPPSNCTSVDQNDFITGLPASICMPEVRFVRFSFNSPSPESLLFKKMIFENQYGNSTFPWTKKRITHKYGWAGNLMCDYEYAMYAENGEQLTNISYVGTFYRMPPNCSITIKIKDVPIAPDRLTVSTSSITPRNQTEGELENHGDWKYNNETKDITYLISSKGVSTASGYVDRVSQKFFAYKCYHENCVAPAPVQPKPLADTRPANFLRWSDDSDWMSLQQTKPKKGDCPKIPEDKWMVVDTEDIPELECIKVYGTLEFEDKNSSSTTCRNFHIKTKCILIIAGRVIIGWENKVFCGEMKIELIGNHTTLRDSPCTDPAVQSRATCGTKAICAFGGLDMHGKNKTNTWTTLSSNANKNTKVLELAEALDCDENEEVVVTASSNIPEQSEVQTIASISSDKKTITLKDVLKYNHRAFKTTTSKGQKIEMAADVGCLTRNIKLVGSDNTDMFGARVLVSKGGFARIENVEFYKTSQDGFVDPTDARFSLTYFDTGHVSSLLPSYIKSNSFHDGYGPAIGLFFAFDIEVTNNVVHGTVLSAIIIQSAGTMLTSNLVSKTLWEGSAFGRQETSNFNFPGAIEAMVDVFMQGNSISGSQRVGLKTLGENCGFASRKIANNILHSNHIGLALFSKDKAGGNQNCQQYNDYRIWGQYGFGIFMTSTVKELIFNGGFYAENKVSVYVYQIGPSAVAHQYGNYYTQVSNLTVIGTTNSFDCSDYTRDETTNNIKWSSQSRPYNTDRGSQTGITTPTISQGSQMAPEKPFNNIMAYPSIKSKMIVSGVHFMDFTAKCTSTCDAAISSNKNNDDIQFPTILSGITLQNVDEKCKIHFYPPNVGKVNPSDCVDMDCDAHKKMLIKDEDGSFLGTPGVPGAVISISELHHNGDKRHGTGDYRIPTTMLTRRDGSRIAYSDLYDNLGIIRSPGGMTTRVSDWNAYKVKGLDYYMLVIESMDEDTELRRISPVALLCDGYLDLANGPQDHGWCFGYTCQKRLSTFHMLVAAGTSCSLYFTGTNPKVTRFFLLHADNSVKLKLSVYFMQPNEKIVYYLQNRVLPKNGQMIDGKYSLKPETRPKEFEVNITTDSYGDNHFDFGTSILTFILQGEGPYVIKVVESIVFSVDLPPMSIGQFYATTTIVSNLASFLGIPTDRIRVVNIVSESSGNRRKRETKNDQLVLEIVSGDNASEANSTISSDSKKEMESINSNLTDAVLSGKTSEMLNVSEKDIGDIKVAVSIQDPGDASDSQAGLVKIAAAKEMKFLEEIQAGTESVVFQTQPSIRMYDDEGEVIPKVGTVLNPWVVTAYIASSTNQNAELQGNTSVPFNTGWANFTNLQITQYGEFEVFFNITSPSNVGDFTLKSQKITITKKNVGMNATGIPEKIAADTSFNVEVNLMDNDLSTRIENISWRSHVWKVSAELTQSSKFNGTLEGPSTGTFDSNSGIVTLSALKFTKPGAYYLRLTVSSTPAEYTLILNKVVTVLSAKQASIDVQQSKTLRRKIDGDFNTIVEGKLEQFKAWATDILIYLYPDVLSKIYDIKPGSILITFTIEGTVSDVNSTIYEMCSDLEDGQSFGFNGTSLTFSGYLDVDGASFYGVNCGPKEDKKPPPKKDSTLLILIIVSCAAALLLILAIVFFIMWKCKVQPNTKTKDIHGNKYQSRSIQNIEDILFREKSFQSLGNPGYKGPRAPAATDMHVSHRQNGHSRPSSRSSMSPPPSYRSNDLYSMGSGKTRLHSQSVGVGEPPVDYPRY